MLVEPVTRTLNGHTLTLRCAGEEDAEMLLRYLKTTCGETPWLARGPEEVTMTVEEEKAFIRGQNESPRTGTVRPLAVTASPAMCAKPSALRFEVQHK